MKIASQHEIVLSLCKLALEGPDEDFVHEMLGVAADVSGIPRDNTLETGACDVANGRDEKDGDRWPFWGYCRDKLFEELDGPLNDGHPERMAAILLFWNEEANRVR